MQTGLNTTGLNTTGLNTILIAGPMNHVGKTTVIRVLSAYWQRYREADAMSCFQLPVMQPTALEAGPDLGHLWQSLSHHQQDHEMVLVESAGGLGTPVTDNTTVADLAWDWRLPTILVAPTQWDAIAPTIAAIALARQSRLNLVGVILNTPTPEPAHSQESHSQEPIGTMLRTLAQVNLLGKIPFLPDLDDEAHLCRVASDLQIETILGKPVIQPAHA
ncbi:MAG: ATP-dependent dethiobiotin synthetase BioD [Leptolyngbyaceae cyanobacterium]